MSVTIEAMIERWSGMDRPLLSGKLIDTAGCKCAQGDVLSCAGFTDDELSKMTQFNADKEVAQILGISRTHAVLLRNVNDKIGGAPQLVLSEPSQIIGDQATLLLAFWLHLDGLSAADWENAGAAEWAAARSAARYADLAAARSAAEAVSDVARDAWAAARSAAEAAAEAAAWEAMSDAARDAARSAARSAAEAAAEASSEIQGIVQLEKDGRQPFFLAFFGFKTWDDVRVLIK
jgi:hypothetical protein